MLTSWSGSISPTTPAYDRGFSWCDLIVVAFAIVDEREESCETERKEVLNVLGEDIVLKE